MRGACRVRDMVGRSAQARPRFAALGIAVALLLGAVFQPGASASPRAQARAAATAGGVWAARKANGSAEVPGTGTKRRAKTTHTIGFDKYSLMIDGQRTFIWSGEFHYWR